MSHRLLRISPYLWFDSQAEEAAHYYISIFDNSRITRTTHYNAAITPLTDHPVGSVLAVEFVLDGQHFIAMNGGPQFKFNEAVSLLVHCRSQAEVDHFWDRLCDGGDPAARQCGWLKDRYGVSWQVVPTVLFDLINDPDMGKAQRATQAMLQMRKLDIATLEAASSG